MIALRRARPADVEAIRSLVRAAYAPWARLMDREPIPMIVDYAKAIERHVIDLHHIDEALAALIEMNVGSDYLFIVNVAVAPPYQRRGLGVALLAHAERFAVSLALPELRLFTNKVMDTNVRLYRRLGYRVDGEEPFRGGIVVRMSKRISY